MDPAQPQDQYVDKLPSPPRMTVPPPISRSGETLREPILTQENGIFAGESISTDYVKPEWGSWRYDERHAAQLVLPCILLGSFTAARNSELLRSMGVTFLVAVRFTRRGQVPMMPAFLRVCEELKIPTSVVDVSDNQSLIAAFPNAIRTINDHLRAIKASTGSLGKVLLCCQTGNELSAALAAAYVLDSTKLELVPTLQLVQFQRFSVNVDDAMKHTLQAYDDILKAQRVVSQDPGTATAQLRQSIMCNLPAGNNITGRRGSKRTLVANDDDELAMDLDGNMNVSVKDQSTTNERVFTPFT